MMKLLALFLLCAVKGLMAKEIRYPQNVFKRNDYHPRKYYYQKKDYARYGVLDDEFQDYELRKEYPHDTQGKGEVGEEDIFQNIEEVNEKAEKEHPEGIGIVSPDGTPVKIFEGDILEDKDVKRIIESLKGTVQDVVSDTTAHEDKKWPDATVYYEFAPGVLWDVKEAVKAAIAAFHASTCIRWVPKKRNTQDYVQIIYGSGCYTYIGKQGGMQQLSLGYGCDSKGIAIHEMMHVVGFWHEQSRLDRDHYIKINYNNIRPGLEFQFNKYRHGQADTLGVAYDYESIMHYGNYAFSKNHKMTIERKHGTLPLGQRKGLSGLDIKQLNLLYNCRAHLATAAQGSCQDLNAYCPYYASIDYCKETSTWKKFMDLNCCASCKEKVG